MMQARAFRVAVPETELDDLRQRIARTRWPVPSPARPWTDGISGEYLADLLQEWRTEFDWRHQEERINALPQQMVEVAGTRLHVVHARSVKPDATPLLMIHGWPSSFWEFHRILPELSDFHVVVASLPGYGWSDAPARTGWDTGRIAEAFVELMAGLGHRDYLIHGSDWGSRIAARMGIIDAQRVRGVHLAFPGFIMPPPDQSLDDLPAEDQVTLQTVRSFAHDGSAYLQLQATTPQTVAHGLSDSPAGLAAWLVEKYHAWADHDGDVDAVIDRADLLTTLTIYWVTNSIGPSMRLYREHGRRPWSDQVPVPAACCLLPGEPVPPVRSHVERFLDVRQWTRYERGGHFAALEQPGAVAADLRAFAAVTG